MNTPTDYETELRRLDEEISELEKNKSSGPADAGTTTRLLYQAVSARLPDGEYCSIRSHGDRDRPSHSSVRPVG